MVPEGQLPPFPNGSGAADWEVDPKLFKDAVADLPSGSKSISIAYSAGLVNDQRIAEAIQQTLSDAGLSVKVIAMPIAQIFALRDQPESDVPNLRVETANSDAAQQDTYQRIFYNTGGFLNYLKGGAGGSLTSPESCRPPEPTASFVPTTILVMAFGTNSGGGWGEKWVR